MPQSQLTLGIIVYVLMLHMSIVNAKLQLGYSHEYTFQAQLLSR